MAAPSLTYTLANGATADASEVMQNLNDLLNGITDGTKDLTFRNLTVNGTTVLGDNTSDDVTINGSLAASVSIKTQYSYDIGTTAKGLRYLYFGSADSAARGTRVAGATVASDWNLTLPPAALVGGVLQSDGSGNTFLLHRPNIGLAAATTTNAADSIKIQGATATLSASNPALVPIPSTTAGILTSLSATADVTILLTGAHWGLGTNGDFTNIILRVYAINDNGTLKWGVSNMGGLRSIADTNTSTTQTNITTQSKMLVNSALTAGTWSCVEVGWFFADFDDTGGAAEDLWAVQTAAGEIMVGAPAPVYTDWETVTMTIGVTGGATTVTAKRKRNGGSARYIVDCVFTTIFTGGTANITLPTGDVIDTSKIPGSVAGSVYPRFGDCTCYDVGAGGYPGEVTYNSTTDVRCSVVIDDQGTGSNYVLGGSGISTTAPFTWVNNDRLEAFFDVPLLGWSGN